MKAEDINSELASLISQFGENPLGFFWVLHESDNENLDFKKQNERWEFVKAEQWHSLSMAAYVLWAISDNGDLLWWNGEQTVAMRPRDYEFISRAVAPSRFIRLLASGVQHSFFPQDLCGEMRAEAQQAVQARRPRLRRGRGLNMGVERSETGRSRPAEIGTKRPPKKTELRYELLAPPRRMVPGGLRPQEPEARLRRGLSFPGPSESGSRCCPVGDSNLPA